MQPVLLLDVVGLTPRLLREHAPNLARLGSRGARAPMDGVLPAVTCSAQATLLTGLSPSEHGAVGNGWLDPATLEPALWRQSNRLVSGGKLYELARERDPDFTCAKLFWWFNQGAAVDWSVTPKPYYPADGRKILDVYSRPASFGDELKAALGPFPFFDFWGPRAGLASSRWIADAARLALERHRPGLTLVYLPHLDYSHQRYGPSDPRSIQAVREVDQLAGELIEVADSVGAEVVAVSEYGIAEVDRPVHLNRALREAGLLEVREGPAGELLDVFASRAFALADHQVAHVYASAPEDARIARGLLEEMPGVERVLGGEELAAAGLRHPRSGQLVAVAERRSWFTYYYWFDDERAPDFARTVDIHRKPGYDPCELFLDPAIALPKLRIALRLMRKLLGFRYLMDVVPLDASLVGGSHGRPPDDRDDGPVFIASRPFGEGAGECGIEPEGRSVPMTSVRDRVLGMLFPD